MGLPVIAGAELSLEGEHADRVWLDLALPIASDQALRGIEALIALARGSD